ncbi:MAG TPA: SET domain-containing protein-lysine N-methyltransferase [Isosphaeraceae bacterium]|jgi:hypothetical protein|nr:SET domain-containing protein-lysine N-methyltransferase [Isosphaeraceae bacterium]
MIGTGTDERLLMYKVRDGRLGKCVHATRDIEPGELVIRGLGHRVPNRTRHSLQVDFDKHLVVPGPLELINHSCDPNCGVIVRPEVDQIEIYARWPIAAGEELGTDYAMFEHEILFMPGPCLCGSPVCRGKITGYKDLPDDRRRAYGRFIAPYLLEIDSLVSQAG